MKNVLLFFALKYHGFWDSIYEALKQKEPIAQEKLFAVESQISCQFLTIINQNYPTCLKKVYKPPFVLFFFGDLALLENNAQLVGVSGGQKMTDYGQRVVWKVVSELVVKHKIILTGDNFGVDQLVLQAILKNNGQVVIITKKPLKIFLELNKKLVTELSKKCRFLVISESYDCSASGIESSKYYLRLLVGLIKTLILVQVTKKDFEYKMKDYVFEDEKKLYVVPEPLDSNFDGSNVLIKNGALIIGSLNDFANDF